MAALNKAFSSVKRVQKLTEPEYATPSAPGDKVRPSPKAKQVNTCGCGELAAPDALGPLLRFAGFDADADTWNGSVLFVAKAAVTMAPTLNWAASTGERGTESAACLDTYCGWNFWRFELAVPYGDSEQRVDYSVDAQDGPPAGFFIAGRDQPIHWGYYSCNGFSPDTPPADVAGLWGGIDPLWRDVLARHEAAPMHFMVGGGDQLYNDDVMKSPALGPFLEAEEDQRAGWAFGDDMRDDVEEYYFHHYAVHFSRGAFGEANRSIPYAMTWDDHDIFDGWGSYPEALQLCDVFQGMFRASRRFFLLFQLHTTPGLARFHGIFGKRSYNQVMLLSPRVALALPDCRSARTENQVLSLDTHMNLIVKVDALPEGVTHLVVGTTVPVVYPHLIGGEAVLTFFAKANKVGVINRLFKRIGVDKMVFNEVEEPELLDDLRDHWSTPAHRDERRFLIEHLQMLAKIKGMRVSLIAGDVHLATTGRLYTYPKPANLARDFRFMPQIVSSAIANAPPPDGLVKALHLLGRAGFTNKNTRNKMCKLFDADGKHRLLNRRNWCEVWELDANGDSPVGAVQPGQPATPGALVFSLRVEVFDAKKGGSASCATIREYHTVAPALEKTPAAPAARHGHHGAAHTQDVYGTHTWGKRLDNGGGHGHPMHLHAPHLPRPLGPGAGFGSAAGGGAAPPSPQAVGPEAPPGERFFT